MKPVRNLLLVFAAVMTASPALAAQRAVTLAVDNMTCASCPYIVDEALRAVPGVTDVTVSHQAKTARVTFDDARASVADLTEATGEAGYPSRRKE